MNELNEQQEVILIECLEALDGGADISGCLDQYPEQAAALRPYLELHARLEAEEKPEPPEAAYEAGRQALLNRVAQMQIGEARQSSVLAAGTRWGMPLLHAFGTRWGSISERISTFAAGGWGRLESPLARVAAAAALLFVLGGGALGASAAVGFQPAREVLSALQIVDEDTWDDGGHVEGDKEDGSDADTPDEGENDSPWGDEDGDGHATPPASDKDDDEAEKPDDAENEDGDDGDDPEGDDADGHEAEKPDEADDDDWDEVEKPDDADDDDWDDVDDRDDHPSPDDVAPTPRPENPHATKTPEPDEPHPTKTPEPEEPTKTPEPEEPAKTPEPEEPAETPEAFEPTKTPEPDPPFVD